MLESSGKTVKKYNLVMRFPMTQPWKQEKAGYVLRKTFSRCHSDANLKVLFSQLHLFINRGVTTAKLPSVPNEIPTLFLSIQSRTEIQKASHSQDEEALLKLSEMNWKTSGYKFQASISI